MGYTAQLLGGCGLGIDDRSIAEACQCKAIAVVGDEQFSSWLRNVVMPSGVSLEQDMRDKSNAHLKMLSNISTGLQQSDLYQWCQYSVNSNRLVQDFASWDHVKDFSGPSGTLCMAVDPTKGGTLAVGFEGRPLEKSCKRTIGDLSKLEE